MSNRSSATLHIDKSGTTLRRAWPLDSGKPKVEHDSQAARSWIATASVHPGANPDREADRSMRVVGGLTNWQYRRVVAFIEDNFHGPARLREISAVISLSASQFTRAFRRSSGESPHSYLLRVRLARARELIETSDNGLSDIAHACGFADQSHMTRLFRSRLGITPGAWRKLNRIT